MKMIVAADEKWGIGKDGELLCHLPSDMQFFKEKTLGKTVIMGRKTLESLPGGKGLPDRFNIVMTKNPDYVPEDEEVDVAHEIGALLQVLTMLNGEDVFIIGGGKIYDAFLPYCDEIFVTRIQGDFGADTFFPNLDQFSDFRMVEESEPITENGITYRFTRYERVPEEELELLG